MVTRIVVLILVAPMVGCAPLGRFSPLRPLENALVFQPTKYPHGDWNRNDAEFEQAHFQAADGTKLHGWYADHPDPHAVALFMHGNAGNIAETADTLRILRDRHQLAVMTFDYRGYGKSEGKPSEAGILLDARAARTWLADRKQISESSILLMGQSLGGAVAVDLAVSDGARGLVLASTFTSLPDVANQFLPWLLPKWNMTQRLNSLEKITRYQGPVLIAHGDADRTIPFEQGQKLFEAAPGRKQFVPIPGGDHNDPMPENYRRALDEFIARL